MRVLILCSFLFVSDVLLATPKSCPSDLKKIVVTGGPSSGKSTFFDSISLIYPHAIRIPEAATLLLESGYPAPRTVEEVKAFQLAILIKQRELESQLLQIEKDDDSFVILDRASVDGSAYWPGPIEEWFEHFETSRDREFQKYDWVLFFQLSPPESYGGNNPHRFHSADEAVGISKRLQEAWASHPGYIEIPTQPTIEEKLRVSTHVLQGILRREDPR